MSNASTAFIEDVAVAEDASGGVAAAYAGALAAAVGAAAASMAAEAECNAEQSDLLAGIATRLNECSQELTRLVDADASALRALTLAQCLPDETPGQQQTKAAAESKALAAACAVPLSVMQECMKVVRAAKTLSEGMPQSGAANLGCAVLLAQAVARAAFLEMRACVMLLDDPQAAFAYATEADEAAIACDTDANAVYAKMKELIG